MAAGVLQTLSTELANAVETAGKSVVRIDDGTRLTASGTIWSEDGVIVATSHGVERDEDLTVQTHDGTTVAAQVLGRDPDLDVAVLKAAGLSDSIKQAPDKEIRVGGIVLALGRPGHAGLQATFGIIGSLGAARTNNGEGQIVHTDAVFYPGFSGGALVDSLGRFVGLVNLGYGRGRGIAIGSGLIQESVDAILANGRIRRGYLGISTQPAKLPAAMHDRQEYGLLITAVEDGSPAEKSGLLIGDTILALGGSATDDSQELRRVLRSMRDGQSVPVTVLRGGAIQDIVATLGARE